MVNLPHERLPEWESPDAAALRSFLATPTGQKLFPVLIAARPALAGPRRAEGVALQAKLIAGYDQCLTELSQLCASRKDETQNPASLAYPPLDDDRYWEGDKLNPKDR